MPLDRFRVSYPVRLSEENSWKPQPECEDPGSRHLQLESCNMHLEEKTARVITFNFGPVTLMARPGDLRSMCLVSAAAEEHRARLYDVAMRADYRESKFGPDEIEIEAWILQDQSVMDRVALTAMILRDEVRLTAEVNGHVHDIFLHITSIKHLGLVLEEFTAENPFRSKNEGSAAAEMQDTFCVSERSES